MQLRWTEDHLGQSFNGWDGNWYTACVVRYRHSHWSERDERGLRHLTASEPFWRAFCRNYPVDGIDYATAEQAMAVAEAAASKRKKRPPTRRQEWRRVANRPD